MAQQPRLHREVGAAGDARVDVDSLVLQHSRVAALRATLEPNVAYRLRQIFRWYSTTFHTPLKDVEDLPLEHVLQAHYEETFGKFDQDDLRDEVRRATESLEERLERERLADYEVTDESLFMDKVNKMADERLAEQARRLAAQKEALDKLKLPLSTGTKSESRGDVAAVAGKTLKDLGGKTPPGVKLQFTTPEELQEIAAQIAREEGGELPD